MRRLIVSPQAGMCNRFRALCSGVLLARLSGRKFYHCWTEESPYMADSEHVRQMRASSWSTFFEDDHDLPYLSLSRTTGVDRVFSEWCPGDPWFAFQSSAIRRCCWNADVDRVRDAADEILADTSNTVLIETSRCLKPPGMSDAAFESALHDIYTRHFRPLPEFLTAFGRHLQRVPFVAVHIRRRDHLRYVRQAKISLKGWAQHIRQQIDPGESICIFGDDAAFIDSLCCMLPEYHVERIAETGVLPSKIRAFNEFLGLSAARGIYGTVGSSFAREAARFGAVPYAECAAAPPAGMASRLLHCFGLGGDRVTCTEAFSDIASEI